jgi:hypothetical protein
MVLHIRGMSEEISGVADIATTTDLPHATSYQEINARADMVVHIYCDVGKCSKFHCVW